MKTVIQSGTIPRILKAVLFSGFLFVQPSAFATFTTATGLELNQYGTFKAGTVYPPQEYSYLPGESSVEYVFILPDNSQKTSGPITGKIGTPISATANGPWNLYGTYTANVYRLHNPSAGVFTRDGMIDTFSWTISPPVYTLTVGWRPDPINPGTGSVSINSGNPSAIASGTFAGDASLTIRAMPDPGCQFVGWEGSPTKDNLPTTILSMNDADRAVTAVFQKTGSVNHPPTITWTSVPGVVITHATYTVAATAHDDDENLASLTITTAGAVFASGSGNARDKTASNESLDAPTGSITYVATAIDALGESVSVSYTVTVEAPVAASIDGSPTNIMQGEPTTISWTSGNATSVSVAGQNLSSSTANGTQTVAGLAVGTYTYTITALGAGGPVTKSVQITVHAPSVSASISASPPSGTAPGSTTISWDSANASSVSVTGPNFTASNASSGSQTVSGLGVGTHTYTITAQGADGPVTDSATFTVTSAPTVTATISATPANTTAPGSTTINWSSGNATSVSVSGPGVNSTASAGSQLISGLSAGTYTFTITAEGPGGPVTRSATATVAANASVTASIITSPSNTTAPGASTVTWSSANATSVVVSGPNLATSTAANGSQAVVGLPQGTHTYTITAQGTGGPVTQQATITVAPSGQPGDVFATISASNSEPTEPANVTVTWTTTNATSASVGTTASTAGVSFSSQQLNGSAPFNNLRTGKYGWTITAQGQNGPVTKTVEVNVRPGVGSVDASISASPTYASSAPGTTLVSWSTSHAYSAAISGPGLSSADLRGSKLLFNVQEGANVFTITAQGVNGPITRRAVFRVGGGSGRSTSMNAYPSGVPWTGGQVEIRGDSNISGPGYLLFYDSTGNLVDKLDISTPAGTDKHWAYWNAPANTNSTQPASYQVRQYGSDEYGGNCTTSISVAVAPAAQTQTVTAVPAAVITPAGSTVSLSAAGGNTGYVWLNATSSNGSSASFVVPPAAAAGTSYTVLVFSPAGVSAGANWKASNTAAATITVGKKDPVVTWPIPAPMSYGTPLGNSQLNATANAAGSFTYSPGSGTILPVGTHTVTALFTPADAGTWNTATASVTVTVNRVAVTVTADDKTRVFGAPDPVFTVRYNGFVNGDTSAALSSPAIAASEATLLSSVGTYAITAAGAASPSYTFDYVPGTLTITPKPVTLAFSGNTAPSYDGTPKPLSVQASDPAATCTVTYTGTNGTAYLSSFTPPSAVGSYAVTANGNGNYTGTATTVLAIAKANPTLTWAVPAPIVYGTALTQAQLNATADVPGTFSYSPSTGAVLTAGFHAVTATFSPLDPTSYNNVSSTVNLTVRKALLTVTANDKTRTYGQANPAFDVAFAGFVNGDTATTAITGSPSVTTSATAASNAGTYTITAATGSLSATNYDFAFANGTLTVLRKPVSFVFSNLTIPYDGTLKTASVAPSDSAATYISDLTNGPDAGAYAVSALATGNYTGSGTAMLNIGRAPVTFVFSNLAQVYDGSLKSAGVRPNDLAATFNADLTKGPDAGSYVVTATATGNYVGAGSATLQISPAPQTITLTPPSLTLFAGQSATLNATGGRNAYVWSGDGGSAGTSNSATISFATAGGYTVSVHNAGSNNYLPSNTVVANIDVQSNRQLTSFTPVASTYTISDPASPMNGQSYGRIWESDGWVAYLGRAGVRFQVKGQAWPAVKTVEVQCKAPGSEWKPLSTHLPANAQTAVDATLSVTLGDSAPGLPLVPLSYYEGSPQTGEWRFRARLQNSNGEWTAFSPEVPVNVILPITSKTISGQTVPPAGELGKWFTASPVQNYSLQFWIP